MNDNWNILGVANLCNIYIELMEENEQLKKQDKINEDCYKELLQKYDKLKEENKQLKKSIECQNETIKEQCIKLDWASECGVKWEKEFKKWNGVE